MVHVFIVTYVINHGIMVQFMCITNVTIVMEQDIMNMSIDITSGA